MVGFRLGNKNVTFKLSTGVRRFKKGGQAVRLGLKHRSSSGKGGDGRKGC